MPLRSHLAVTVFACALIRLAWSARITIERDKTNQEYPNAMKIKCEAVRGFMALVAVEGISDVTIVKDDKGEGSYTVAYKNQYYSDPLISKAMNESITSSVGEITKDGPYGSLTLILGNPKVKDTGVYTCIISYEMSGRNRLEEIRASAYLKVDNDKNEDNDGDNYDDNDVLSCEDGWTLYEKDKFCIKEFASPRKSWKDARSECQSKGGDLVRIEDPYKQIFFAGIHCEFGKTVWLGLRRTEMLANNFTWLDDSTPANFINWNEGEPNNFKDGEDCVSTWESGARWNDKGCYVKYGFACEKPATSEVKLKQ